MSDREKVVIMALGTFVLFLAPGYVVHVSPRFGGSLGGGILGVTAAALMVLVLLYPAIKYIPALKACVTRHVSMGRLLSLHIWGGLVAAISAILHSGHNYQSILGIALVINVLIVVATGFVGRFYLGYLAGDVRRQQALLGTLRSAYDQVAGGLARRAQAGITAPQVPVLSLVESIADAEFSLTASEAAKDIAARWTVVHVVSSIVLYALLLTHIGSGIYYGLRWLP